MTSFQRLRSTEDGISLVEVLVVMVLFGIIATAAVQVMITTVRAEATSTELSERMSRARLAIQRIREDVRFAEEICPDSDDRSLELYDVEGQRTHYDLVDEGTGTARLEVTDVSAGTTSILAKGFVSQAAFDYLGTPPSQQPPPDADQPELGLECGTPAAGVEGNPFTEGVAISLTVADTGTAAIDERTLDTEVQLRNANLDRTIVTFNPQPTARFSYSCADLVCEFDADQSSDDGEIHSYTWDFGDDSEVEVRSGSGITHTFPAQGIYDVTLTVKDDKGGTGSTTEPVDTTVPDDSDDDGSQAPDAAFTQTCDGLTCTFDGGTSSDPDGDVVSWSWTFGDGTQLTDVGADPVERTYASPGEYEVALVVTDDDGLESSTATTNIVVTGGTTRVFVDSVTGSGSNGRWWTATAEWTIATDPEDHGLSGALVRARWDDAGTVSCTTDSTGTCDFRRSLDKHSTSEVRMEIVDITLSGTTYDASANRQQAITMCNGGC